MLTAPDHGVGDEQTTPLGLAHLIGTLGRLVRLMTALEDLARYDGPTRLSQSWIRVSELLHEATRLAHAGARQASARRGEAAAFRVADHIAQITEAARAVDEHAVGSARWWLAVHALGQRAEGSYWFLAGLQAEPSQSGRATAPAGLASG